LRTNRIRDSGSGKRPVTATLLAVLPTIMGVLAVITFAIDVIIHGF
jgi:hypothetical protein